MGTILNRYFCLRDVANSLSDINYLSKPSMIKEETVSPGCTLAESTMDLLAVGFPIVNMGISLPS
jgi:hypothetical protein